MGRKYKGLWKPSYVLKLCPKPYRPEHRRRLQYLLRRLVNQQDWVGASGVINVYLKGTLKDSSISKNRFKFWALLELLKHVGNHSKNLRRIKNLYDVWSKKIGSLKIRSRKTWAVESRYAVLLENMMFYLMQGDFEKAYQLFTFHVFKFQLFTYGRLPPPLQAPTVVLRTSATTRKPPVSTTPPRPKCSIFSSSRFASTV